MKSLEKFLIWSQYFSLFVMVMIAVAFFSLLERKILSLIHFRVGPNKVLLMGLLQPISDALKLVTKDDFPAFWSNFFMYYISPLFMFTVSLSTWSVFPFFSGSNLKFSVVILMIFLGMSVYGILISGWSSNSKYALIGGMRSVSQTLSYEVLFSFLMLNIMIIMTSYTLMNFQDMLNTFISFMCFPMLGIFLITALAELNRTPFDLSEGESELVSGYSVEYGGIMYTLLFLSENISIFTTSFMVSYFFFTGLNPIFMWVLSSLWICVIRGVLPRIRYDKLMLLCWMILLPMILLMFNFIFWMTSLS